MTFKHVDEYRARGAIEAVLVEIRRTTTRPWTLMEVCGGQTHSIVRYGLDRLLPPELELVHGPGCPVCVTSMGTIDAALHLAALPDVIFCTFGDMLRVPGSAEDLYQVKARGGDVRVVYSPLDAVALALAEPSREVVFFAIGFETTAPANAMAVVQAAAHGLTNFTLLTAQVLVPPASEAILAAPDHRVQGFLAAGHVCTVMGLAAYRTLAERFRVPIVATGFEPLELLAGVLACVRQLELGRFGVENAYSRSVRPGGNEHALAMLQRVFEVAPQDWRGLGVLPDSGLVLRPEFARFDAARRFALSLATRAVGPDAVGEPQCQSGAILRGMIKPAACPAFGTDCTPESPLGAPMVSSEGACAAYFRYRGFGSREAPAH